MTSKLETWTEAQIHGLFVLAEEYARSARREPEERAASAFYYLAGYFGYEETTDA